MLRGSDGWILSATDLVDALECDHRSALKLAGLRPGDPPDPLVIAHGLAHEQRVVEQLRAEHGDGVLEIGRPADTEEALAAAADQTRRAMDEGRPVIVQGVLFDGRFQGRADLLIRVGKTDVYEPYDTKLARHAKPGAVLQLAAYADALGRTGRAVPEHMHLILGDGQTTTLRVQDHLPLLHLIASDLRRRAEAPAAMPEPSWGAARPACATCGYAAHCRGGRIRDRDLGLVAGLRGDQRRKLRGAGLLTLEQLAEADDDARPATLAERTFTALRAQARMQAEQDRTGVVRLEVYSPDGLAVLPDPSPGDLFFDFEGDPFFAHGEGLEYLVGVYSDPGGYRAIWSHDRDAERRLFEQLVDLARARLKKYPEAHLYHYAAYEPTALKRLAQRHGTRENEVDDLLREERLVDLYAVVRRSVRVSQRSYSIKDLEPLYMAPRLGEVASATSSIEAYDRYATLARAGEELEAQAVLGELERYNRDDCTSTALLAAELVRLRDEHGVGHVVPMPPEPDVVRPGRDAQVTATWLANRLRDGLPADDETWTPVQLARSVLAGAVGYHRRESLPAWWDFYWMVEASLDELAQAAECAVPERVEAQDWRLPTGRQKKYRRTLRLWADPDQPHPFRPNDPVRMLYAAALPGAPRLWLSGTVTAVDADEFEVLETSDDDLGPTTPIAVLPGPPVRFEPKDEALAELARACVDQLPRLPAHPGVDLLLRGAPRLAGGGSLPPAEDFDDVIDAVLRLDGSTLAIQGPPGAGKTYLAGRLIRRLVAEGRTVGVCATGHHAIENTLLAATGRSDGSPTWAPAVRALRKVSSAGEARPELTLVTEYPKLAKLRTAEPGGVVIGGTSWTFAHRSLRDDPVDYLLIDEAGQFALADALAVSTSARNVVLLGDPQQLPQVIRATHPAGSDASALGWVLGDADVVPDGVGYFLATSRRMHPGVCARVSALSYQGLLHAHPSAARRGVEGIEGGLHTAEVVSEGCTTTNPDEVAATVALVRGLIGRTWVDEADPDHPVKRPLTAEDVLVVAPFNRMVRDLQRALPGVRVGTVDRFQGQEAPVAVVTLTASSGADLPRGLEFLLSRNRLNVALSRAQALSVLVFSPELLRVPVGSVGQMRLVSGLAGLVEGSVGSVGQWPPAGGEVG